MKRTFLFIMLGWLVAAGLSTAASAKADDDQDHQLMINLGTAGIIVDNRAAIIDDAHRACNVAVLLDDPHMLGTVIWARNPNLTKDQATIVAYIAGQVYCPSVLHPNPPGTFVA